MGFVEHLNHDAVRIRTVERCASIAMDLEGMHNDNAARAKFVLELFYPIGSFDYKSQMIKLLFRGAREKLFGDLMEREIIAAGREIDVFRIRLPDHIHAEELSIKLP